MKPERLIGILGVASRVPVARLFSPRSVTILMYHGIPRQSYGVGGVDASGFEEHVRFLTKHFSVVANDHIEARRYPLNRPRVLLMFDDGFRNNAEVAAPILRAYGVPATFFVCSRHTTPGKFLWFSYLSALHTHFPGNELSFRDRLLDMGSGRERTIQHLTHELLQLNPHPSEMYRVIEEELPQLEDFVKPEQLNDNYAGMTAEQVEELSSGPLFSFGAHTVDHPFLTRCSEQELNYQISEDKRHLEQLTRKPCDMIAYPCDDYNYSVLECCRSVGFRWGYSVNRQLSADPRLEMRRVGVYSRSLSALTLKAVWGNLLPASRLRWPRRTTDNLELGQEAQATKASAQTTLHYLS